MSANDTRYLQDGDRAYLKSLTNQKARFLEVIRAVYRANRLLCEVGQALVRAELENIREAFGLTAALSPEDVYLIASPKPDYIFPWEYEACTAGARIRLPDRVGPTFSLFVEISDNGVRLVAGLEFPSLSTRTRWLKSRMERPDFAELDWESLGFALEQAAPLEDLSQIEEALANVLQGFLAEVRRVRPDPVKA